MDFLRLYLPGLHQALRGALDSFSTFVSYLIGDAVPTVEREAQAAEELGVMAVERPGKTVEEEAQEALEGLRGGQSKGDGRLGGPGEAGRCQGGSSAAEQAWGWGDSSPHGSQTDRQDTGVWEAAKVARCQEPSVSVESGKKSEARSGARRDRSSQAQEKQEPEEQEVNRGETLRTWEQEEEEEVRAREPGMARGVESEWTWHRQPEGKAAADGQKVAGDSRETEQVVKEASAGEPKRPGAREVGREEEVAIKVKGCQSTSAQGIQSPGEESEDWATLGREEAGMTWAREEAYLPGVRETVYGPVPGERIPEATGRVWVLEEGSKGAQEEEVSEKKEAELSLFPKQAQALGPEAVEEAAEGQTAGREAAGGQEWEKVAGEGLEGRADQRGKEAEQASLEDVVQAEEAQEEKGRCWATEAELSPDKEARGDVDLEATTEARAEEDFTGQRSEEAQMSPEAPKVEQGGLQHKVTEGQESKQMGGTQTPTKQPEEGQGGKEELWRVPALSKEETERSLEDYPGHLECVEPEVSQAFPEAWENQRRRDEERGDTQEEEADAEEDREVEEGEEEGEVGEGEAKDGEEEASGVQALEAEARGSQASELPEVLEAGGEGKKAKEKGCETEVSSVAETQELNSSPRAGAGTGWSLGESDARETKLGEVEATRPQEPDRTSRRGWRLEGAALGLRDRENTQTSAFAAEMVEDKADLDIRAAGAGAAWEGESGRSWDSEGREAAAVTQSGGGQEFGLEGSAEEEVVGRGGLAEALEAGEGEHGVGQAEAGASAEAEGSCGLDHLNLSSQAVRTEGTRGTVEVHGLLGKQIVLEKEAGEWQAGEQREDSEGQHGDCHPEGEARGPLDEDTLEEEIQVTGGQTEAEEMDPEGLEHIKGQEKPVKQDPAEAAPGPLGDAETAEATGNAGGDAHSSWSEALLPGSPLDVSVPRSRVLLSRSSSQRRSRPSFCRTPASEQQEEPPSPQPAEGLSAPEQSLLQLEEPPEPRPLRPEGTPVPARRRPLGHGFGLAHLGMMQELQARLGQPKPQ